MARRRKTHSEQGRKRDRTKWKDDRYVPISPSWLRAVMTEQEVTVSALARQTGLSQQSIDAILTSGEGRTTRSSRRAALAEALGVAEELLGGAAMFLPSGTQLGYEYGYSASTWLAAQRLLTKVAIAAQRDVACCSPALALEIGDTARCTLEGMVRDLMQIGSWRERLLRWTPARHARQGYREPLAEDITNAPGGRPVADPAHEEGVIALIRAIEHLLTPWFEDRALLDYAAIREFTTSAPARHTKARVQPAAVIVETDTSAQEGSR